MVQTLCYLLECLLTPENTPPDCAKELYELYFVFAAVWAFGGALFQDQVLYGPMRSFTNHHDVSTKFYGQIKVYNCKNIHLFVAVQEKIYVTLPTKFRAFPLFRKVCKDWKRGRNVPETAEYFLLDIDIL